MYPSIQYVKALADETRLRLMVILNKYELNVNELVQILEMGQSRISRHLKILSSCGLLIWRREGLWVFYNAAREGEPHAFFQAVLPFLEKEPHFEADLAMAAGLIEERVRVTRQFFNSIAEDWDKLSREVLGPFDLSGAVAERMKKCGVAVDLGCGTGNVMQELLQNADSVIGVDGSARMLELSRRRFLEAEERISLRIGDLSHLPLRDGEADFACINMVLHHLPSPVEVLAETRRVLSPGGRLVITDFKRHNDERMRAEYGDHWLGFEKDALCGFLEKAGFKIVQVYEQQVECNLSIYIITAENTVTPKEKKL